MIIKSGQVSMSMQAIVTEIYYVSNHWNFISNHWTSLYRRYCSFWAIQFILLPIQLALVPDTQANCIGKIWTGLAKNELDWQKTNWIAKSEQYCYNTTPAATRSHFRKISSFVFCKKWQNLLLFWKSMVELVLAKKLFYGWCGNWTGDTWVLWILNLT